MSTEWYYALGEEQKGPVSEEELRSMLLGGNLPVDIKVWSKGMSDWASAKKVQELYRPAPPVPELSARVESNPTPSPASASANPFAGNQQSAHTGVGQRTPEQALRMRFAWNRFLARLIDYHLLMMVLSFFWAVQDSPAVSMSDILIGSVITFGILGFIEAFLISKWGMTPGKWIFRIRVVHKDNRLLTYGEALRRTFQVVLQGMCLGIPPMNLLFQALALKEYIELGSTSWDRRNQSHVQHANMRSLHLAAAIGVSLLIFAWIAQLPQAGG